MNEDLLFEYKCYYGPLLIYKSLLNVVKSKNGWINDELINFSISRVIEGRNDFHMFPSHFYSYLFYNSQRFSYEDSQRVANLKRNKIDIFSKDVLLIPINYNNHWSLVVVIRPLLMVRGKDSDGNYGVIVFLDSLGAYHMDDMPIIREQILHFLWCEWESVDRLQYTSIVDSSKYDSCNAFIFNNCQYCVGVATPKQENGDDCGVFVITYVVALLGSWPQESLDVAYVSSVFTRIFAHIDQQYIDQYGRSFLVKLINDCANERIVDLTII